MRRALVVIVLLAICLSADAQGLRRRIKAPVSGGGDIAITDTLGYVFATGADYYARAHTQSTGVTYTIVMVNSFYGNSSRTDSIKRGTAKFTFLDSTRTHTTVPEYHFDVYGLATTSVGTDSLRIYGHGNEGDGLLLFSMSFSNVGSLGNAAENTSNTTSLATSVSSASGELCVAFNARWYDITYSVGSGETQILYPQEGWYVFLNATTKAGAATTTFTNAGTAGLRATKVIALRK